jgi:hypothetical protein
LNQIGLLRCICGQCLTHPKDPQDLLDLHPIIHSILDVIATATDKGIETLALQALHLQLIGVVVPLGLLVLHLPPLQIGREAHLGQVHLQVPVLGLVVHQ